MVAIARSRQKQSSAFAYCLYRADTTSLVGYLKIANSVMSTSTADVNNPRFDEKAMISVSLPMIVEKRRVSRDCPYDR